MIIIFLFCPFYKGQNKKGNLIGGKYEYIEKLSDNKVKDKYYPNIWESKKISDFLNSKTNYFIITYGGEFYYEKVEEFNIIKIIPINYELKKDKNKFIKEYNKQGSEKERYLFVERKVNNFRELTDTLKIPIGIDYSIIKYNKKNKKNGIGIGKYYQGITENYFEMSSIYGIDDFGKLQEIKLNTLIYDCLPDPYYTKEEDENDIQYFFGVIGKKKYKRYWNEKKDTLDILVLLNSQESEGIGGLIFQKENNKLIIREDLLLEIIKISDDDYGKKASLLRSYVTRLLADRIHKIEIPYTDQELYKIIAYTINTVDPIYYKYYENEDVFWGKYSIGGDIRGGSSFAESLSLGKLLTIKELHLMMEQFRLNNYYNLPEIKKMLEQTSWCEI